MRLRKIGLAFVTIHLVLTASETRAQSLSITTIAGSPSGGGWMDASGTSARFSFPYSAAVDATGTVYIADSANHVIRRITPTGDVTTIAGMAGVAGSQDGTGTSARFNFPRGVAVGPSGEIYVSDSYNHTLRSINTQGVVTTIAGLAGAAGTADGVGSAARFTYPRGVRVDEGGNIIIADTSNHTIRRVTPSRVVTTIAGTARSYGSSDGFGPQARFYYPYDVALGPGGFVYVADTDNHMIRKISPEGHVTTVAGKPEDLNDPVPSPGSKDGVGADARFNFPWSIEVDGAGNVFVADTWNHLIRKITPSLVVSTVAGGVEAPGSQDGSGTAARFYAPSGLALHSDGTLFIVDRYNQAVRRLTTGLAVTTVAGSVPRWGTTNARGTSARFFYPGGVALDPSGNVFVSESSHAIRKITPDGGVTTLAGLQGAAGSADGTSSVARFRDPRGVTVDPNSNIIVADTYNHTIRKITAGGVVTTLAGVAGQAGDAVGAGTQARFDHPFAVACDSQGNLYVADTYNHRIKLIDPFGVVSNFAGSGNPGSSDGVGTNASFRYPTGITVDGSRVVAVADWGNHTVRRIMQSGQVSTIAGSAGNAGSADGTGSSARFDNPWGVAARPDGTLYITDTDNMTVRRVGTDGAVTTVAGHLFSPGNVDGTGTDARFFYPDGIASDASGRIAVADTYNHAIRVGVVSAPSITSFSASTTSLKAPGAVTLTWSSANASSATLDNGIGNVPAAGSRSIFVGETTRFTLTVSGDGGTATASVTVRVGDSKHRAVRH